MKTILNSTYNELQTNKLKDIPGLNSSYSLFYDLKTSRFAHSIYQPQMITIPEEQSKIDEFFLDCKIIF